MMELVIFKLHKKSDISKKQLFLFYSSHGLTGLMFIAKIVLKE